MAHIILDSQTAAKFRQAPDMAEVLDEKGAVLGYFQPSAKTSREDVPSAGLLFTDEEIDRAEKRGGGMTTPELLKYLESL